MNNQFDAILNTRVLEPTMRQVFLKRGMHTCPYCKKKGSLVPLGVIERNKELFFYCMCMNRDCEPGDKIMVHIITTQESGACTSSIKGVRDCPVRRVHIADDTTTPTDPFMKVNYEKLLVNAPRITNFPDKQLRELLAQQEEDLRREKAQKNSPRNRTGQPLHVAQKVKWDDTQIVDYPPPQNRPHLSSQFSIPPQVQAPQDLTQTMNTLVMAALANMIQNAGNPPGPAKQDGIREWGDIREETRLDVGKFVHDYTLQVYECPPKEALRKNFPHLSQAERAAIYTHLEEHWQDFAADEPSQAEELSYEYVDAEPPIAEEDLEIAASLQQPVIVPAPQPPRRNWVKIIGIGAGAVIFLACLVVGFVFYGRQWNVPFLTAQATAVPENAGQVLKISIEDATPANTTPAQATNQPMCLVESQPQNGEWALFEDVFIRGFAPANGLTLDYFKTLATDGGADAVMVATEIMPQKDAFAQSFWFGQTPNLPANNATCAEGVVSIQDQWNECGYNTSYVFSVPVSTFTDLGGTCPGVIQQ